MLPFLLCPLLSNSVDMGCVHLEVVRVNDCVPTINLFAKAVELHYGYGNHTTGVIVLEVLDGWLGARGGDAGSLRVKSNEGHCGFGLCLLVLGPLQTNFFVE